MVNWHLVTDDDELAGLLARADDCATVMVDTEFMRRNTFFPQAALVQLCFAGSRVDSDTAWLIDPLAIEDTRPLAELLARPDLVKVVHSASEDLEVFQRWPGVLPEPLFDTQRAAGLLGIGFGMGYRNLVQEISGVDVPKGETCSDWLQRPLTDSQCEYAALDVICLLPVWAELQRRCLEQNKLDWVLADSADAVAAMRANASEYHLRIKGAWKLQPRQLAALAAICRWREDTARRRDKPRGWIIDDRSCLQLAQLNPQDFKQLEAVPELPSPVVRRYGEELLALLAVERETPENALPASLPEPLSPSERSALKSLKRCAARIADELGVVPEALLQSRDYELLLREQTAERASTPAHWHGWRRDLVIAPLRQHLLGAL